MSTNKITIPAGWEQTQLGKITEVLPSNVDKHSSSEEKPVFLCNYMDVYHKNEITSTEGLSSGTVKINEFEKFKLCRGDVLITKDSETPEDIARSCVVAKDFDDTVCGYHLAMIKGKSTKINGFFLKRVFDIPIFQHYFSSLSNGVTRFGLTKPAIEKAKLLLPPLPEQKKIVEVLETWDRYLERLNQIIKLKKKVKKGLMQKLLTGEYRLPGFTDKWNAVKLGQCLRIRHGKSQKAVENPNGKYPILGTGGIIGRATEFIYNRPSVLIGRKGTIDKPRYIDEPFWTIDTLFYSEINNNNSPKYLYYNFLMINWKSYNEGSGIPSLSATTISSIEVKLPSLPEQTAIAAILTAADREIETLEKKKSLIEQQKKFLLNNLITGKIRLPEFIH